MSAHGLLLLALSACCGAVAQGLEPPLQVIVGAIECEFTRTHLDVLKWRDRFVIGDPHSDPRPAARLMLLTDGWRRLAEPEAAYSNAPAVQVSVELFTIAMSGTMPESGDGPGRWRWQQTWTVAREGRVRLRWDVEQLVEPAQRWWLHRISLIGNRAELFVTWPNKDQHTPGKPIPIVTRDGTQSAPLFGGEGNIVAAPREVRLPHSGYEVVLRPDPSAASVELWNGWWQQCVNFELPVREQVSVEFEIDLTTLPQVEHPRLTVATLSEQPQPWLEAQIPPLERVGPPLRCAQSTPTIIAWGEVRTRPVEELERFFAEMAPHFDVMELPIAWTDWKWDLGWDTDAAARAHAQAIAAEARKQIEIARRHGITLAVSLNFGGSGPGTGRAETRRQPQFQGERFDPESGEFVRVPEAYDWGNRAAAERGGRAWEDAARLIGPVGYLFFNEPCWRLLTWYEVPMFSQAALEDFREFTGDPQARFPAKPWAAPTDRTDNEAGPAQWARWREWLSACLARMIRVEAEAFATANAENPDYGGAIYFQNVNWTGPQWAVDLERIATIPQVTWLCAEYVTRADAPAWRMFRYFAARHGKRLSSFVNAGYYDPDQPGRVRYEGTDESFEAAVRMGLDEGAGMVTLYPADSLDRGSAAYHPARTAIWDRLTAPR
ncbi:MAG: hypothetical protein AB7Y46_07670 [Armatimonadota bacterium]